MSRAFVLKFKRAQSLQSAATDWFGLCPSALPHSRTSFPIKYLGLPLSLGRLKKVDFQPLSNKANGRLANWIGKFLTPVGRKTLVKAVLSSQPIYYMSALNAPTAVLEEIDRRRKCFLWMGTDQIAGERGGGSARLPGLKCKPTRLGGLGILNLKKFARAYTFNGCGKSGGSQKTLG